MDDAANDSDSDNEDYVPHADADNDDDDDNDDTSSDDESTSNDDDDSTQDETEEANEGDVTAGTLDMEQGVEVTGVNSGDDNDEELDTVENTGVDAAGVDVANVEPQEWMQLSMKWKMSKAMQMKMMMKLSPNVPIRT